MPTQEERYDEAIAIQQSGDMATAVEKLQALIADYPDYALSYSALSVFCSKLDRHDEAIVYGRKVCDLEPEDPFSFTSLSMICQKAGQMGPAEEALMSARKAQLEAHRRDLEVSEDEQAAADREVEEG